MLTLSIYMLPLCMTIMYITLFANTQSKMVAHSYLQIVYHYVSGSQILLTYSELIVIKLYIIKHNNRLCFKKLPEESIKKIWKRKTFKLCYVRVDPDQLIIKSGAVEVSTVFSRRFKLKFSSGW